MKRRTSHPVNTTSQPTDTPSGGQSRVWILGIVGIALILIVLQFTGILKSVDKASTTGWIDLNSAEYQNRPMPQRRPEKPNPNVEATLHEIAEEFEGPIFSDISTANSQKGWGLSDDEAKFYDDMRDRYAQKTDNWLGLAKKSFSTYRLVKEAFGGSTDVVSIMKDARTAANIYQQLSQQFGISPTESHNFAQSGAGQRISDWANFVENNKRK